MHAIFKKLNWNDQPAIYVLDAPEAFLDAVEQMHAHTEVRSDLTETKGAQFVLAFATTKKQVDHFAGLIAKGTTGDAVVWIAYPKGTSKKYRCEFNRDDGWDRFGAHGFESVRQVAIDEDWSALRFRRVEFIKTMTRGFAMTEAGKVKTSAVRKSS